MNWSVKCANVSRLHYRNKVHKFQVGLGNVRYSKGKVVYEHFRCEPQYKIHDSGFNKVLLISEDAG